MYTEPFRRAFSTNLAYKTGITNKVSNVDITKLPIISVVKGFCTLEPASDIRAIMELILMQF